MSTLQTYVNGTSFAIAVRELQAWDLTPSEFHAAIERVRDDFRLIVARSLLVWQHRPHTREIELYLAPPRSKAEAAGDSAFREILEDVLPTVRWEVHHG